MPKLPKPDALVKCPFPKHRDVDWEVVVEEDRPYMEWLVSIDGPPMSEELYSHIMDLLEEHQ